MPTINIQVKINSADQRKYAAKGNEKECLSKAIDVLKGLSGGALLGAVTLAVSSNDPVMASGTVTLASVADADTVTIGGTVLTAKTTPSGSAQWARGVSDAADAAALAACINANATTSAKVHATVAGAVVTVAANAAGTLGNLLTLASSGATLTVSGANLTGGTGGAESAPVTLGR